ncbi:hypothetical protein DKP76_12335 [Falsochrobactrum shanghaiense]|uniref:Cellulose biosynthesis protein BcsN n=1 Tax=Falsochrobactrum shanghaiense TaxID=2201899 RepID=A0A316J764_9HYPH|nr:hypothetical protein DKP76_12335 [Falsochrobactrum shanghaiense]
MKVWYLSGALFLCLALASCATGDPVSLASGKQQVSVAEAFILPGDRPVSGVVQERASNAIIQKVILGAHSRVAGESYLKSVFFGPVNSVGATEKTVSYQLLDEARIARELRAELPGVRMTRSPFYVQNNYGPFGYATGTSAAGDTCLYAWQQIRSPAYNQNLFQNLGRIDVRLRICENGARPEALLSTMYNYTINATISGAGWNPFGEPAGPSADLGRLGRPIYAPAVSDPYVANYPDDNSPPTRKRTAAPSSSAAAAAPKPAAGSPVAKTRTDNAVYPANAAEAFPQAPIVPLPQQVNPAHPLASVPSSAAHNASLNQSAPAAAPMVPFPAAASLKESEATVVVPSPCNVVEGLRSSDRSETMKAACP